MFFYTLAYVTIFEITSTVQCINIFTALLNTCTVTCHFMYI